MSDSSERKTDNRDPNRVDIPKNVFAFRFFDREEKEQDNDVLKGSKKNYTGWYYINGVVYTADELIMLYPDERHEIMRSNIRNNNIKVLVRTPYEQFIEFKEKDQVFETDKAPKLGF